MVLEGEGGKQGLKEETGLAQANKTGASGWGGGLQVGSGRPTLSTELSVRTESRRHGGRRWAGG